MHASYRRLPRDRELKISDAQLTETMATKWNPVLESHQPCGVANHRLSCSANGIEDFEGGMFGRRAVNLRRMTREPTHRNRRCLTVADRYWKAHVGTSRHTMTVKQLQKIRVLKEDQGVVVRG